jgi:hypothetical protein
MKAEQEAEASDFPDPPPRADAGKAGYCGNADMNAFEAL